MEPVALAACHLKCRAWRASSWSSFPTSWQWVVRAFSQPKQKKRICAFNPPTHVLVLPAHTHRHPRLFMTFQHLWCSPAHMSLHFSGWMGFQSFGRRNTAKLQMTSQCQFWFVLSFNHRKICEVAQGNVIRQEICEIQQPWNFLNMLYNFRRSLPNPPLVSCYVAFSGKSLGWFLMNNQVTSNRRNGDVLLSYSMDTCFPMVFPMVFPICFSHWPSPRALGHLGCRLPDICTGNATYFKASSGFPPWIPYDLRTNITLMWYPLVN